MNSLMSRYRRMFVAHMSIVWFAVPCASSAQELEAGVVAEVWPLQNPAEGAARRALEVCRKQKPTETSTTMDLKDFVIPARPNPSLVRVRGLLNAPESYFYSFTIDGNDEAELWMEDTVSGEWRLVQRERNPNKRVGAVKMEQGVPRRFEFWTMGSGEVSVSWESTKWETKTSRRVIVDELVPGSRMQQVKPGKDEKFDGDALRIDWKRRNGLALGSDDGPSGMWGDPDNDGLLNWQEQLANTDPRKADAEGATGFVRWEIWRNIPGKFVFDLTRVEDFPQKPDEVRYLRHLEVPVGYGDAYGSRMRGEVKAPASGEYRFMIIADDTAELWLGETGSAQSKRLIARVEQSGAQSRWTRRSEGIDKPLFPEQVTGNVHLEKDKTYYIEVLHKQLNRIDHCSVAWVLPGAESPVLIGANSLISWKPNKEDSDDDGLPDSWQQSAGLMADGVDPASRSSYADADHDGLSNRQEWKAGSNPLKAEATETEHMLTCESWVGISGSRISLMTGHPRFPAKPDHTTLVDNMDFKDEGDNYGCRLRGFLTAPEDGPFVFNIAGNDACILYLGRSEDEFTKRVVAQTTMGTDWRSFGANASYESEPVDLRKDQKYYIEVLFKRGVRPGPAAIKRDHASVAWKRPGREQTVIDAEYFSPYKGNNRDGDADGLPDDFEKNHGLDPHNPMGVNGAAGDKDHDWLENFAEFQAGLDPSTSDVHGAPGFALWECWENIRGGFKDLKSNSAFPLHPSQRKWVTSLEGPQAFGDSYGSRMRAFLIPPATGDYTFAIAGDNQCELWLSESDLKYYKNRIAFVQGWTGHREWNTELGQISRSISLVAGKRYFIEVLHLQGTKQNHVSAAWRPPGAKEFEIIQGKALAGFAGDPNDVDDDDLPDDFEEANGFSLDTSDGERDPDGDGLTNRDEFRRGTRPNLADSDGDGIKDGEEVHIYQSDPLLKDVIAPVKLADISLDQFRATPGLWTQMPDGELRSTARQGAADFPVKIEKPGIYMVEIQASARSSTGYSPPVLLVASVDGFEIGRAEVTSGGLPLRWLTPWLSAGTHTITIDNRNVRSGVSMVISSLTLYQHEGEDLDGNDNPDWMDNLLRHDNHFTVTGGGSPTSPVCIEGESRYPENVRISGSVGEIKTELGLTGQWFANVPLDPSGETKVTATFENGALHEQHAFRWTATNLFEAPATIRVRVGDSLKLTAVPPETDGAATISKFTKDGEALGEGPALESRVVTFDTPGTFTLAASAVTGKDAVNATVRVEVLNADFGPDFSLASGYARVWDLPNMSHSLAIHADPDLRLDEYERQSPLSRRFNVRYPANRSANPRVLARLWEDGPIAAVTSVNAFWFVPASITGSNRLIQTLSDGTRVVEVRYVLDGPIPPGLSIWLQLYVTDAVFGDGSSWHQLTAADFDENGMARILIYKAPGTGFPYVCHWIRPFYKDSPDQ